MTEITIEEARANARESAEADEAIRKADMAVAAKEPTKRPLWLRMALWITRRRVASLQRFVEAQPNIKRNEMRLASKRYTETIRHIEHMSQIETASAQYDLDCLRRKLADLERGVL